MLPVCMVSFFIFMNLFFVFYDICTYLDLQQFNKILFILYKNKDENVHRFATRGKRYIDRWREKERVRGREREREREKERVREGERERDKEGERERDKEGERERGYIITQMVYTKGST